MKSVHRLAPIALLLVGCASTSAYDPPEVDEPQSTGAEDRIPEAALHPTAWIELQRAACYGRCPAYVVRLDANGSVEWIGLDHVGWHGRAHDTIAPEVATGLIADFAALDLDGVPTTWGEAERCATDHRVSIVTSSSGRRAFHEHSCQSSQLEALALLEARIDTAADVGQWLHERCDDIISHSIYYADDDDTSASSGDEPVQEVRRGELALMVEHLALDPTLSLRLRSVPENDVVARKRIDNFVRAVVDHGIERSRMTVLVHGAQHADLANFRFGRIALDLGRTECLGRGRAAL